MKELKDVRAPAFPDEPYSGYCKVCWNPVYALWADSVHHGSGCHSGHDNARDCHDAMGRAKFAADMNRMRELHPECFPKDGA